MNQIPSLSDGHCRSLGRKPVALRMRDIHHRAHLIRVVSCYLAAYGDMLALLYLSLEAPRSLKVDGKQNVGRCRSRLLL